MKFDFHKIDEKYYKHIEKIILLKMFLYNTKFLQNKILIVLTFLKIYTMLLLYPISTFSHFDLYF